MAGKIPFIPGLGAGYVLRTRAKRAQYGRTETTTSKITEQPFVHTRIDAASSHVKQATRIQGEVITEKVTDTIKERLFGASPSKGGAQSQPVDTGQASVCPIGGSS